MNYEFFVGLAVLLWLAGVVSFVIAINSQFERNLRKAGARLSWLTLAPKPMSESDRTRGFIGKAFRFLLIYGAGLVSTLLGPVYVLVWAGIFANNLIKGFGAPPWVKEYRWRMKNVDMTTDEIMVLSQRQSEAMAQPLRRHSE